MAKAAKKNNVSELKIQIKENRLSRLYVFYGEEEYLKEYYIKKISDLIPDAGLEDINHIVLNGKVDYGEYAAAWEGMPMMTDRRLLLIRDSNIFTLSKSKDIIPPTEEEREFWNEKLKRLSDDTVVIFCEKNVDGRSALFKAAKKAGVAVEFKYMTPAELKAWVIKRALKAGKKIDDKTAEYLISVIDPGMNSLEHETDKLLNFCDDIIYRSDVDRVVSKSTEVKIFDLTDGISEGNADRVLKILGDLRTHNESAFSTLYLIYSNITKLLKIKLSGAASPHEAVAALNTTDWLARKYLSGAEGFSEEALMRMVMRVPEIDYEIKSGLIDERTALEQYILEAMEFRRKQ